MTPRDHFTQLSDADLAEALMLLAAAKEMREALEAIQAMPYYPGDNLPEVWVRSLQKRYNKALDIAAVALGLPPAFTPSEPTDDH